MSRWLTCGIATKIIVIKDEDTKENILKGLKKEIDINIYNVSEDDSCVYLDIKENVFKENAIKFVIEQLELLEAKGTYIEREIEKLCEIEDKSYNEIIEYSKARKCLCFQMDEGSVVSNNVDYLLRGHTVFVDAINYIFDGKIIMECGYNLFSYLRKAIIKSSNSPIKTAAVVTITG